MKAVAFQTAHASLYLGDVRALLHDLADESVDCVVTSPPYWGLRSYGTAPQVWDGDPDHAHAFEMRSAALVVGSQNANGKSTLQTNGTKHDSVAHSFSTGTCACGAWLGEYGLESTPELYVAHTVEIFREIRRALRPTGTLFLNLGDSYSAKPGQGGAIDELFSVARGKTIPRGAGRWSAGTRTAPGLKPKDLIGIPWRVAFALQADGWYLRSDIIWVKPNPMPESVSDRPTKSHEYVFLLTKSEQYAWDQEAVREPLESSTADLRKMREQRDRIGGKTLTADDPLYTANASTHIGQKRGVGDPETGRNVRTVWTIPTTPYADAHFAVFPEELPRRCILAGCPERVCATCGKPSERIMETLSTMVFKHSARGDAKRDAGIRTTLNGTLVAWPVRAQRGWTDCGHGAYVPGVVLEPFAGSGTTLAVAAELGRTAIGFELNDEYLPLIERRVAGAEIEWSRMQSDGPIVAPTVSDLGPLWEGVANG